MRRGDINIGDTLCPVGQINAKALRVIGADRTWVHFWRADKDTIEAVINPCLYARAVTAEGAES